MAREKLRLDAETWGERLHRAYRRCRQQYGFIYAEHAAAISAYVPVSDQSLMRWEGYDEEPKLPRQRQTLYLTLLAYGFEPEEFGLTVDNSALSNFDMKKVRAALDPAKRARGTSASPNRGGRGPSASSRCTVRHERGIPQEDPSVSAGQTVRRAA